MASTPFPVVLRDHTKAGIRLRVSIYPELSAEGTVVRFLKRGRSGRFLDQLCRWSPQRGWAPGHAPSARVPKVLRQRIEAELQRRHRRRGASSAAAANQAQVHRSSIPGVSEAIGCGRISIPAFLAMELIEAYLPLWQPQPAASQSR